MWWALPRDSRGKAAHRRRARHTSRVPDLRPMTLIDLCGATGAWLFPCPEPDLHLAGTIDQAKGQRGPYSIMIRMLRA